MPTTTKSNEPVHYINTDTRPGGLIPIRITRAIERDGVRIEAGQTLNLRPLEAAQCCATGRAHFLFSTDIKVARDAMMEEDRRISAEKQASQKSFWSRSNYT